MLRGKRPHGGCCAHLYRAMRRKRLKETTAVLNLIDEDPSRGQVFWFLHREHDEIKARAQGKRIPWRSILATVQALGLTNADGNPVTTTKALMKTWSRVCDLKRRDAESKRQRAEARRRPTNEPPPVVHRTVALVPAPAPRPPLEPVAVQSVSRAVVEEQARLAAQRRPDLFPNGPDVSRYKILKGRRDV